MGQLLSRPPTSMSSDLWAAVATGDVDAARTLLQQPGVDVDAYDADGATLDGSRPIQLLQRMHFLYSLSADPQRPKPKHQILKIYSRP